MTDVFLKTSVSLLFYPQISQEEALLAVAVFPAIRELDICSNPLITQRISNSNGALSFSFFSWPVSSVTSLMSPAGDPPSLTQYLQHRLGITVKSNSQPVTNLPLRQPDDPKRKVGPVSHQSPEFTKSQLVYLNDSLFFLFFFFAFATFLLKDAPRHPRADRRRKAESRTNKGQDDTEKHPGCLFLTQVRWEMKRINHCLKKELWDEFMPSRVCILVKVQYHTAKCSK